MKFLAPVLLLLAGACGCASNDTLRMQWKQAPPWDVFWYDMEQHKTRIFVVRAAEWRFEDGCFIAEKPVPYLQCDVIRVRPCTEDCD